jgi:uncharacterized protein YjiS (DUF1127 family)
MQKNRCNMTSLVVSFPSGLTSIWSRLGALLDREREIMRIGLARRAAHRKNFCVLRDLNDAELAELGLGASEIQAELKR